MGRVATWLADETVRGQRSIVVSVAGIINGLAPNHQAYFAAGGMGILIGDGALPNYWLEQVVEAYYSYAITAMFAILFAVSVVGPIAAKEYPIGKPKSLNGMEVAAVYLKPIEMDPPGMMRGFPDSASYQKDAQRRLVDIA